MLLFRAIPRRTQFSAKLAGLDYEVRMKEFVLRNEQLLTQGHKASARHQQNTINKCMFDILSSNTRRGLIVTLSILIGLEGGIVLTKAPVYKSPKIGVRVPDSDFMSFLCLLITEARKRHYL